MRDDLTQRRDIDLIHQLIHQVGGTPSNGAVKSNTD
jgi:hypothetical protein